MFPQQEVLDKLGAQFRGCLTRTPSLMMGSDDGLTSRRRASRRPRRDFRRGLRITTACPWPNSWDHQSNKCQSHVQPNYWHSKKSKSQLQPVKIQLIARNRRVLTLRMRAGLLTGRTRAPREPYCPRQCRCPGCPGFGQCWDIGLGNRIERSSHRSAGARIASFSLS
jgi:hypothetical protein